MRLVKKIKFKRAQQISQFKKIECSFNKIKSETSENPSNIRYHKDISTLNFYLVVEYVNLINEKIDYNRIFPENPLGHNSIIDYNNLLEEQEKLKEHIDKNKDKGPDYFKKMGILNEIVGCYFIATTKKNVRSIKKIDFNNKDISIVLRFDTDTLPKEFKKLCEDYAKNKFTSLEKEDDDFQKFMNLNPEEQENILDNLLYNVQFPPIIMYDDISEDDVFYNSDSSNTYSLSTATTIEFAAENNLSKFTDIEFLKGMLTAAVEKENYELCAKIRDRLIEIGVGK